MKEDLQGPSNNLSTVMESSLEEHESDDEQAEKDSEVNDESFASASSQEPQVETEVAQQELEEVAKLEAEAEVEASRLSYVQDKLLVEGYAAVLVKHGKPPLPQKRTRLPWANTSKTARRSESSLPTSLRCRRRCSS